MLAAAATEPLFDLFEGPIGRLVHASQEAIVMIDEQQNVIALNPAAEHMFRCEASQVLNRPLDQFLPIRARTAHAAFTQRLFTSGVFEQGMGPRREVSALRADGSEFPISVTLSRVDLSSDAGPRRCYAALISDLSELRAAEDELARVVRRFRSVFELAPIAIWIAESDRLVFANAAAGRLFDVEPQALIGQSIYQLLCTEAHAQLRQQVDSALAGDDSVPVVRGRVARIDGQQREVEIALAAMPDHGRTTVQMVVSDVTQRRGEALALERSQQALRQLSASVVEAREEERRRIARELHDELGQRLSALKMDIASLNASTLPCPCNERLADMMTMLDDTMASVRRIAADLRPLMLDDLGLNAAIDWLANNAARRMGVQIEVTLDDTDPPLDQRAAIAVYRMVQEALTNVSRHARATEVHISLQRRGSELVLTVADNGIGFEPPALQREGAYGLMGMRERSRMLGGRLAIDNRPEGGCRITVHLPLTPPRDASRPA